MTTPFAQLTYHSEPATERTLFFRQGIVYTQIDYSHLFDNINDLKEQFWKNYLVMDILQ